jgi:hypothetical protein
LKEDYILVDAYVSQDEDGIQQTPEQDSCLNYGTYNQQSLSCPICTHKKHNDINLLRAKQYKTYRELATELSTTIAVVKRHFESHFILSPACQRLVSLRENSNESAQEIVRQILEEDLDLISGAKGVLKSKANQVTMLNNRIQALQEEFDRGNLDPLDAPTNTNQFIVLIKALKDAENDILKTYKLVDDKLFPSKEEFNDAFLHFQLAYLKKMIDNIQAVFIKYQNQTSESGELIDNMRKDLAQYFNGMELEVASLQNTLHGNKISEKSSPIVLGDKVGN